MTARLILNLDDDRIAFPLEEGENVIGRKKACEIYVRDGSLSKFHARILRQGERLEVVDAGSRNGTLVNGDPITPEDGPIPVIDGDEIKCGKLTFLVEGAAQAPGKRSAEAPPPFLVDVADSGRRWELRGSQALGIGSRSQNHVRLEGPGISRFHAELSPENGEWVVKDLGSRNGVFVNDQKVDVHVLTPGDVIKIGTSSLRYGVPAALGTVLADPRKRLYVIAGAVLGILLLAMSFGPTAGGIGDVVEDQNFEARFEAACTLMIDSRHNAAQEQFKRLKEDKPEAKLRNWVRVFDQVSRSLEDYEDPLAFDWDRAEDTLSSAVKLNGLPPRLQSWVDEREAWVKLGKRAYALLEEGAAIGNRSIEAARKRKFKDAFALQREARDYLGQVEGPLAEVAEEKIAQAWIPVLKESVTMIKRFMRPKSKPPHWGRAQELIEALLPLTLKVKERTNLRRYLVRCTSNMKDEELYRAAIRIVERGEVEFHGQAVDFLRQVARQSSIYRDAQAMLAWLQADELVRGADKAFADGRGEHAMRLLRDARDQHDTYLGDDARQSIDRRVVLISQVMSRWQRGKNLGLRAEALKPLEEVVSLLEDQPRNFYRTVAQRQFDHIRAELSKGVDANLRKGLETLQLVFRDGLKGRTEAELAMELFERVRRDPNHKREHILQIKSAVKKGEEGARYLYNAEKDRKMNRENKFEDMIPRLKLLKVWLPPGKKQAEASELYKLINERLRKMNQFRKK